MTIEVTLKFTLVTFDDVTSISPELEAVAWVAALRRGIAEYELEDLGIIGIVPGTRTLKVVPMKSNPERSK